MSKICTFPYSIVHISVIVSFSCARKLCDRLHCFQKWFSYADGKLVAYNTAVAYPIGIVFAIAMLALFIYATKKNTEKKAA